MPSIRPETTPRRVLWVLESVCLLMSVDDNRHVWRHHRHVKTTSGRPGDRTTKESWHKRLNGSEFSPHRVAGGVVLADECRHVARRRITPTEFDRIPGIDRSAAAVTGSTSPTASSRSPPAHGPRHPPRLTVDPGHAPALGRCDTACLARLRQGRARSAVGRGSRSPGERAGSLGSVRWTAGLPAQLRGTGSLPPWSTTHDRIVARAATTISVRSNARQTVFSDRRPGMR